MIEGETPPRLSTASAVLIAGWYLVSAFADASAALLFGSSYPAVVAWPNVFYVKSVLAALCLVCFREEFCPPPRWDSLRRGSDDDDEAKNAAGDLFREPSN
uniref:Uncharacterized protein n=1 Tax=Odontella aurita TaxID=265563 RepID=A0A7S4HR56_9STRA|mmetsp:Transcript_13961/g.40867  ORF Transcript_13961/g.40867 Transcript_13961/m.40867 type:complete len:101 (+) Transcript_13961:252-554(+)